MRKRCNEKVENVDFEKLKKCLKDHGIKYTDLSTVCGYYPNYIKDVALPRNFLNTHVRDVLTYAYKIDPSEYIDTQPKEVINTEDTQQKEVANAEDDEMYTFTFSINWKLLKRLTMLSIKEHITIEGLVSKFIIKGIGEKIVEESENE
jgi:hypothetical protein